MGLSRFIRRARVRRLTDGPLALRLHKELEGQLAVEEVHHLMMLARRRATIVEIGSFRGKSCVCLALGSADVEGQVTAIDPHFDATPGSATYSSEDEQAFHANTRAWNVDDRVTHLVKPSMEARADWPNGTPIDLLWIDGDHRYDAVRRDLLDWAPLVAPGGTLACHDYDHWPGVNHAWDEFLSEHEAQWRPLARVRSIVSAERVVP